MSVIHVCGVNPPLCYIEYYTNKILDSLTVPFTRLKLFPDYKNVPAAHVLPTVGHDISNNLYLQYMMKPCWPNTENIWLRLLSGDNKTK